MHFEQHTFPGDEFTYITPTWLELQQLTFEIAREIRASGRKFDRVVTLARGGWPMTRCLVDFLEISEVASIGVKFYAGIDERLERPQIYQDLPVSVIGERILLFDDVADTGISLEYTSEYLTRYKGVSELATATQLVKPGSAITPDFSGAETTSWIVFPYDAAEMITILGQKWLSQRVQYIEIIARFEQLGFAPTWIEYYMRGLEVNG